MVMAAVLGGAFLGGLADRMKENREYTKKKSDETQAYLYNAGIKRQNEVMEARQQLTEATDYLDSKGMSTKKLTALLDQNPKEVIRLASIAVKAETKMTINGQVLDSAVDASGYGGSDLSPSDLIKKATPDFVEGAALKKPDEVERGMLQELFRAPDLQEIMYDAYSSDVLGVKGKDIQASIAAPTIKARKGEDVVTDFSKLNQLDGVDIFKMQRELVSEYDIMLDNRIIKLKQQASQAQTDQEKSKTQALQKEIVRLQVIQDIDNVKERFNKMLVEPNIGFDSARQYYDQYPEIFRDRPIFIDQNLLPFISGEEDYESPENNQGSVPATPESDNEVQIPEISKPDNQSAIATARKWFGKIENRGQPLVQIKMPDGSLETFSREGGTKRVILDSEET